ncbi:efflux RND transporter periplasmic adaptor subunit [Chitinophaga polysaccharea]|uniref:efflux RND transporter periplasmic adaptor subunit n=1 Tax=Chitinophaga TaxID=79328 RepID=UPI0014551D3B|nr:MULTISPECIES: efflux RND transporter periplasmic adaptor subunit [Chitinophaga]NLR58084.1 efflux RND transporter periplasmic adaptor subunit [Chitinophaga polysaccharea]NLU93677.1 efflux RND transporter periplasmic adaptor subunit [Chitinophaga sp. Ak27]
MMKHSKYYLSALSVITGLAACNSAAMTDKKVTAHNSERTYTLAAVVQRPLEGSIRLPGALAAFQKVSIYPRINGFVKSIGVDRGSKVRKGQVLLVLEAPEVEQQYYAAKSKYLQAAAMFASSKDNFERTLAVSKEPGTISAHDLELAKARMLADSALMNSEQANFRAQEVNKSYLTVTAPFDGVITERNIHPGALVGPDTKVDDKPMLMLEQEDKLRLILQVPEMYSAQLGQQSQIAFDVDAIPGKHFQGAISRQAGTLNDKYRSEAVEIDVQNASHLLKAGMYAEVLLPLQGSAQAMLVPSSAVVMSTERKYVVAVKDHYTRWVDVEEGNHHNDSTEVFGHLQANDQVIINATDEIKDGVRVP